MEGVCLQEVQDPASQYLEENRDMCTLKNKVVCSLDVKSPLTPFCLLVNQIHKNVKESQKTTKTKQMAATFKSTPDKKSNANQFIRMTVTH